MADKVKTDEIRQAIDAPRELDAQRLPAVVPPAPYPIETLVPKVRQQTPAVGQRATRPDARLHGLGQTRYIADMTLPNMLHAKIKRASIASALIKRIDTREAEAMPGVVAVLTGSEIPVNSFGPSLQDQPVLAQDRVFHAGDGVAAVAAVTEQIATEALEKIRMEYEPLPAVFDPLEALRDDAPRVHPPASNIYASKTIRKGDIERGFAEAYRVFEATFRTQMVEHVPLEPHAAIADWDANGRLTLWSTLGRITLARGDIARTLKLPMSRIRIVATIVGGNFGGKNEITQEPVLALLAKKARRPVKGVYTRGEEFTATTTRHPFIMEYKTGVTREGRILARKVRLVLDGGAYCSWSETTLGKACILSAGPYKIENLLVEAYAVYTNKTMTGAMRGFGAPQVCFAYESHMDDIAAALAIDPLDIRLLNAFDEGSVSPTGQALHSVVVKDTLLKAAERYGWKEPRS
ncbi:MAG TPA: molybdopterin cofactor-binding domain-containing protein [Burkholderiales bacterium]|nr:molybdopterin cofactor-binding domain-containing protein [Burkholderiales bacterium]